MNQSVIERINSLAKKAREEGLSAEEAEEQKILRKEYIAMFRANLSVQLENTYIVDEKGNKRKLQKKDK